MFELITQGLLLGVGLAMDAFSISVVNGMNEPGMGWRKRAAIAGVYAVFQILMPLLGWLSVHTILETFQAVQPVIPWIAFLLLGWIGGKMLWEGIRGKGEEEPVAVRPGTLLVQGVATSIDALSAGFAMAELNTAEALTEAGLIGLVTFLLCWIGLHLGRKIGVWLSRKATILGGIILIGIGLRVLLTHLL